MKDEVPMEIPDSWYKETESTFVCLRCHKTFKKEYTSGILGRKKRVYGAKSVLSVWARNNFRRHLLRCWRIPEEDSKGGPNV